jgi:anthranilate phosphoribosyltransferase
MTVTPEGFGAPTATPADLKGGDRERNAEIACAVLAGGLGPQRDVVLVNASAALVAAGKAANFREGVEVAARSINSGAAWGKVEGLADFGKAVAAR